jgi:hypothetical protein
LCWSLLEIFNVYFCKRLHEQFCGIYFSIPYLKGTVNIVYLHLLFKFVLEMMPLQFQVYTWAVISECLSASFPGSGCNQFLIIKS